MHLRFSLFKLTHHVPTTGDNSYLHVTLKITFFIQRMAWNRLCMQSQMLGKVDDDGGLAHVPGLASLDTQRKGNIKHLV
jgi:hypothetical protein